MLKLNNKDITGIYLGSNSISKIYAGQTLVWQKDTEIIFPAEDSLLHYWNFNESSGSKSYDSVGTTTLTASNSAIIGSTTAMNELGLNCAGSYYTNGSVNFTNLNKSFSVWVYPTSNTVNSYIFDGNYGAGTNRFTIIWYPANTTYNGFGVSIGGNFCTSSTVASINTWHHIVGINDGTTTKMYIDNVLINSKTADISENIDNFFVGNSKTTKTDYFTGYIDELCIFDKTLTEDEIADLYNNGNGVFYELPYPAFNYLLAYYPFEEESGTEVTPSYGTIIGTTTGTWGTGINGFSHVYDGVSQKTTIESNNELTFTGSFSISTWIYPTLVSTGEDFIIHNKAYPYNYRVDINNGYINFAGGINGNWNTITDTTTPINTNTWYHIVAVYDATQGKRLYINGSLVTSNTSTGTLYTSDTSDLILGGYYANNDYQYNGKIDELGMWNRVLTADEIADLYNGGNGTFYVPLFPDTGLSLYYSFDNVDGTTIYDDNGSNNGTASNTNILNVLGKNGNSVDFTQGNDYVLSDYPSFGSIIAEATISFWIKNPASGVSNYLFSLFDTAQGDLAYELYVNESNYIYVYLRGYTGSNQRTIAKADVSGLGLNDSNWHHCVVRQKASTNTITFFVDGNQLTTIYDSQQLTSGFANFTTTIAMGNRKVGNNLQSTYANCLFDEVCTWDRILSESEINTLYNNGNGLFYVPVIVDVTGVNITSTAPLEIYEGFTKQLEWEVLPSDATNKDVTFSSSDTNIATVDSDGVVTGVANGTCTITVTTVDGSYTDSISTTVMAGTLVTDTITFTNVGTTTWTSPSNTQSIEYLVVAGGGAGSYARGGGGGAGGLLQGTISNPYSNYNYNVVVGEGGTGALTSGGDNGGNSEFDTIVATGGGGSSSSGGSGGGAYYNQTATHYSGVEGQGHEGGSGTNTDSYERGGGGGGGSAEAGADATATSGGKGGDGIYIGTTFGNIGADNGYIAAGGGGGKQGSGSPGADGGLGGAGDALPNAGGDAIANTGSGGGASGDAYGSYRGGHGASGIVAIKVTYVQE